MCQEELEIWTVTAVKSGASVKKGGGAGTAMLKGSGASTAMLKASHKRRIVQGCWVLVCVLVLVSWGVGILFVRCWGLVCSGLAALVVRCLLCAVKNLAEMAWCVCETLFTKGPFVKFP